MVMTLDFSTVIDCKLIDESYESELVLYNYSLSYTLNKVCL